MHALSYTRVLSNLAKAIDRVAQNHEPIVITRQKGESVVLMSLEDFNAWQETAYLLRSPANAERLLRATQEVSRGAHAPSRIEGAIRMA